jgi:hypothetical protein
MTMTALYSTLANYFYLNLMNNCSSVILSNSLVWLKSLINTLNLFLNISIIYLFLFLDSKCSRVFKCLLPSFINDFGLEILSLDAANKELSRYMMFMKPLENPDYLPFKYMFEDCYEVL